MDSFHFISNFIAVLNDLILLYKHIVFKCVTVPINILETPSHVTQESKIWNIYLKINK